MGRGRGGQRRHPPRPGRRAEEQLMASVIKTVSFDATDALALAAFWVTGAYQLVGIGMPSL